MAYLLKRSMSKTEIARFLLPVSNYFVLLDLVVQLTIFQLFDDAKAINFEMKLQIISQHESDKSVTCIHLFTFQYWYLVQ